MASAVDIQAVTKALERNRQLTQTAQRQVGGDPSIGQRLGGWGQRYWWMPADAMWSLAKAGVEPDTETAFAAAQSAAAMRVESGRGFEPPGSVSAGGKPNPQDVAKILQRLAPLQRTFDLFKDISNAPTTQAEQLVGPGWYDLTPAERSRIAGLKFVPVADEYDRPAFEVDGDTSEETADILQRALSKQARVQLGGPWSTAQHDIHGKRLAQTRAATNVGGNDTSGSGGPNRFVIIGDAYVEPGLAQEITEGSNILKAGLPLVGTPLQVGFTALNAPLQELSGVVRNIHQIAYEHEMPNIESQSDFGIWLGSGGKDPLGPGVFGPSPDSPITIERQRRELTRGTVDGQPITAGRWLASALPDSVGGYDVMQPGSGSYRLLSGSVDMAAAVALDPSAWGMKKAALYRQLGREFTEPSSVQQAYKAFKATGEMTPALQAFQNAGGIHGIRPSVSRDAAPTWVRAPEQAPFRQALADETDAYTIWKALGKPDPDIIPALVDNTDPDAVADILVDSLGPKIRTKPRMKDLTGRQMFPRLGNEEPVFVHRPGSRFKSLMPAQDVPADDLRANLQNLERLAPLVRMPGDDFGKYFDRMIRTTDDFQREAVYIDLLNDTVDRIMQVQTPFGKKVTRAAAQKATRQWRDFEEVDGVYSLDQISRGLGSFDTTIMVNGKPMVVKSSPHSLKQHLNSGIPMPDWRRIRRDLSPLRPLLDSKPIQGAEWLLEAFHNNFWKPVQIARVATLAKILGDEQLQFTARGYDTFVNHPFRAMSVVVASPLHELPADMQFMNRLRQVVANTKAGVHFEEDFGWLSMANPKMITANVRYQAARGARGVAKKLPGVEPEGRFTLTPTGEDFEQWDELQRLASHGFETNVSDPLGARPSGIWQELHHNPGVNTDEFVEHWARQLAQFNSSADMRGAAAAGSLDQATAWYLSGPGKKYRDQLMSARPELADDAVAAGWMKNSVLQIEAATGGNPTLIEAVANGKLDGIPMWTRRADGSPEVSARFIKKLNSYLADAPQVTRAPRNVTIPGDQYKQMMDGFKGRMLQTILGTPSAVLTKIPMVRQIHYAEMKRLAVYLTPDDQARLLVAAEKANAGAKYMKSLRKTIAEADKNSTDAGRLTLEQADEIAKHEAIHTVEFVSDEFANRSQFFDVWRLWSPFGDVWRRQMYRWGKTVQKNPATIRRAQQTVQALQGSGLGEMLGGPADQGFFHPNSTGEEVWTVPGSYWASAAATGAPMPLAGRVQGLSIIGEVFPGLGPAGSIPVAWTLDKLDLMKTDTPFGKLGEVLFPYGPPRDWNNVVNFLPSWIQKVYNGNYPTTPEQVSAYNSSVIDYLRYGITTGDFDMSTPEGMADAIEKASKQADKMFLIRSAAAFLIPGAPSPEPIVRDRSGKVLDMMALIEEYYELNNEDANTGAQVFMEKYGPEIFAAVTPKSWSYIYGLPTSPDSVQWVDDRPKLKRDMPHIYGYFAPPSDPDDFDFDAYRSYFAPGAGKQKLSTEQWALIQNARVAALEYGRLRDKVDIISEGNPTDEQLNWLAAKKQELIDTRPGYAQSLYGGLGVTERPDARLLVAEAIKALDDPDARGTEAGTGLGFYVDLRNKANANWVAAGYKADSWTMAENEYALEIRNWLRSKAHRIATDYPQFGPLFDGVFEREMRDDTDPRLPLPVAS